MNKRRITAFLALSGVLLCGGLAAHAQAPGDVIAGRYIVQLRPGTAPAGIIAKHGLAPEFVYTSVVNGFAGRVPPGRLRALQRDGAVVSVVPDRVVAAIAKGGIPGKPNKNPTEVVPSGVARIGATGLTFDGSGIGVAVVDTGLDFNHGDLVPIEGGFSAFGGSAQDDDGHGTHVGGIIAARDNEQDVVGVAPGAALYAVKVLDASGKGTDSTVLAGLNWVSANLSPVDGSAAIRVVNMSLGRPGSVDDNPALHQAVQNLVAAGVAVVVAAGNDAAVEVTQCIPAAYPEAMAIASTTAQDGTNKSRTYPGVIEADTASYFTTDGAEVVVSAPGEDQEDITRANIIKSVGILSTKLGGGTTRMLGTSMAAPHVAGVAALMLQKNPSLTSDEIRTSLEATADRAGTAPLASPTSGYSYDGEREGVVSAVSALNAVP
ncbi:MAG TPA: S8 family serine peptidase [Sumerlaeia bacterium]|nr:S8 family serine peptidase [Sumerlaeia bacterium]